MKITVRAWPTCWEDNCSNPITTKSGVLCRLHRTICRQEAREERLQMTALLLYPENHQEAQK